MDNDPDMRTRPPIPLLSWEDVKEIIQSGNLALLGRSDDQQAMYNAFRTNLKSEWDTVGDYILATKFGLSVVLNHESGKKVSVRQEITEDRIVAAPNDFPYNFENGIHHVILWKVGSDLLAVEIEEFMEKLKSDVDGLKEIVMYVNPPSLKSVLDVDHAHILYKVS